MCETVRGEENEYRKYIMIIKEVIKFRLFGVCVLVFVKFYEELNVFSVVSARNVRVRKINFLRGNSL